MSYFFLFENPDVGFHAVFSRTLSRISIGDIDMNYKAETGITEVRGTYKFFYKLGDGSIPIQLDDIKFLDS